MERSLRERHHEMVVERLRSFMTDGGLDALVAFTNENITYINTIPSCFLNDSGWQGLAMIVIPREGDVLGICSDFERSVLETEGMVSTWLDFHMWIYIDDQFIDGSGTARKATESFRGDMSAGILADYLRSRGIDRGRIGLERGALHVSVWEELNKALPDAVFLDASPLFYDARYVKTPYEIGCLRHAARSQEQVVFDTMGEVEVGMPHEELLIRLRSRALARPGVERIRFIFVSIGPYFAPSAFPYRIAVAPGDLIKYDGALVVRGYGGDSARTFVAGDPSETQQQVYRVLAAGHEAALELMKPGTGMKEVFRKAMGVVQEEGLPRYVRGHVGHSVGLSQLVEEPPFLSPHSERLLVPGNVLCLELPYYAHGFGAIMNEDIVLITEDGHELLTTSPRGLHPIGDGRKARQWPSMAS